jgi:hypothetical protein
VVENVKLYLLVEFPGGKVGTDLPKVSVELEATWEPQQVVHPTRQIHIVEGKIGNRLALQFSLDPSSIGGRGEDPDVVKSGELSCKIPAQHGLAPADG